MTYVITWDYMDSKGFVHHNNELVFDDKDKANTAWKEMKSANIFLNMQHSTRGTETEKTEQMYNCVRVRFTVCGKIYTYLTKTEVKVGEEVIVRTHEGREILKVEWSGKQTRSQLEKALPFDRYQYISGKVVAA